MEGGEQPITPEVPKKGAPIHIILERHDDVRESSLNHLDKQIGDNLRKKKIGNVVVFLEAANLPFSVAEHVQNYVKAGYYPSYSFGIANFANKLQRYPDLDNPDDVEEMTRKYNEETNQKTKDTFAVLDEHFREGMRLRLLFEGVPDEEYAEEMQEHEKLEHAREERYRHLLEGNLDQAVDSYKQQQQIRASNSIKREDRLAERIADASLEEDVVAVVGQIGAAHSRLGDVLKEKGHDVTQEFADEDVRTALDSLTIDIERRLHQSPDQEIPELDWYRGMIGSVVDDIAATWAKEEREQPGSTENALYWLPYMKSRLRQITDMDSIRRFEGDIREIGFMEAMTDN